MARYYGRPTSVVDSFGPGPITPAVKAIILANIGFFVVSSFASPIFRYLGLVPEDVVTRGWLWQPATYMFLHADVMHILFNMLGVWMFGTELERRWGTKLFAKYYAITGIGAGLIVIGAAKGIGHLAGQAMEGIARQPEAGGRIGTNMIIAAALIEGFTFFALVIALQLAGKIAGGSGAW